jgi:hypothetical protein
MACATLGTGPRAEASTMPCSATKAAHGPGSAYADSCATFCAGFFAEGFFAAGFFAAGFFAAALVAAFFGAAFFGAALDLPAFAFGAFGDFAVRFAFLVTVG